MRRHLKNELAQQAHGIDRIVDIECADRRM
jgi:hypothetical protein